MTEHTPRDFGFLRSRSCCGVIVLLMAEIHHTPVSCETVRRWLHRERLVWLPSAAGAVRSRKGQI